MSFLAAAPVRAGDLGHPNVVPLIVRTPHGGFNRMVVSVTVCVPETSRCATIDDIMVDTGSTGLRLEASAVPPILRLPPFLGPDQSPLAECLRFVHDTAWGPLYRADLQFGGLRARNVPIQIIADAPGPQPDRCPPSAVRPTSNGTLGLGPHRLDCQGSCEQSATQPGVFVDHAGTWLPFDGSVPPAYRLPNPVSLLPDHNNGVVFDLPATPGAGATEVTGTLTFGVGTAANNGLGRSAIVRIDRGGLFTTLYKGTAYPRSYIDSGTETLLIADTSLPICDGEAFAFCMVPERRLDAVMVGQDGARAPLTFKVGDYRSMERLGATDGAAFAIDPSLQAFVWGAPFFFGRRVTVVFEDAAVPGPTKREGPFYAFE